MSTQLEKIRAALAASEAKSKSEHTSDYSSPVFPFWKLETGQSVTVRLLPIQDQLFPWIEKNTGRMPFQGIVGGNYPTDNTSSVVYPYPSKNPVAQHIKDLGWWKDTASPEQRQLARTYYVKRKYVYACLVINSPLPDDGQGLVRILELGPNLHDTVKNILMNPEIEDIVTDFEAGRDLKITKSKKGEFADYSGNFSFKARALSQSERHVIEQAGIPDLAKHIGTPLTQAGIDLLMPLFNDSVNGLPFDHDRFGEHFRAYPDRASNTVATSPGNGQDGLGTVTQEDHARSSTILSGIRARVTKAG